MHKTFCLSYTKIGFEAIDPQGTKRPRVPSEAGFASQCATCPYSKRTMDSARRGVYTHNTSYLCVISSRHLGRSVSEAPRSQCYEGGE